MPDTRADDELMARITALLGRIQENGRPLPWVVHSGCSYRRIASEPTRENNYCSFPDGNVLHALNHRSDGHPDLSMGEDQLSALVEIINLLPTLIATRPAPPPAQADVERVVIVEHLQGARAARAALAVMPSPEQIRAEERKRIVAWLREEANNYRYGQENAPDDRQADALLLASDAIERGNTEAG